MVGIVLQIYHKVSRHITEIVTLSFSLLVALGIIILTNFGAASDETFVKMVTFSFQWSRVISFSYLHHISDMVQEMSPTTDAPNSHRIWYYVNANALPLLHNNDTVHV